MCPERIGLPFDEPPETREAPAQAPLPRAESAAELVPEPSARRVRTVSELTAEIRALLEASVGEVWVEGELSNCRVWNTGHLYFTLKDASAQLKGVMFRSALKAVRFKPEDGLRVVARGRISVYEPKGEYQIVCEHLEPHGFGALQLAFEQLKKRLQAEGLFDAVRKRPLPVLPRTIGIVTSIDGAALRDILQVLGRRHPNLHILIRPTRVQGDGAATEIAAALGAIASVPGVDVVIVGRGGGSIEDLWAFNEEQVARAIVASSVPVISAVGHEVDVTIADFAADVRAPTPSAAAELVVARKEEFGARIDRLGERLRAGARGRIERMRARTHRAAARPGLAGWPARLALKGRLAAELTHDLRRLALAQTARRQRRYQDLRRHLETVDLRRRLGAVGAGLDRAQRGLRAALTRALAAAEARFGATAARLDTLSPMAVLGRGYAVCWNGDKTAIIRDAATVGAGEAVRVTLARGELACRVEGKTAD